MENRRFMLIALVGVVLYFLYHAWETDYGPKPETGPMPARVQTEEPAKQAAATDAATPASGSLEPKAVGELPVVAPTPGDTTAASGPAGVVSVRTDLLAVQLSLRGGEMNRVEFLGYPTSKKTPDVPLPFLNDRDGQYFVMQSGVAGTDRPLASTETLYTTTTPDVKMSGSDEHVDVVLEHKDERGFTVKKTFRFTRGSYRIELEQQVVNESAAALTASPYARLVRNATVIGDLPKFTTTFLGTAFYEQNDDKKTYKFHKVPLKKLDKEPFEKTQDGGWVAMLQHYFVAAIIPPAEGRYVYSSHTLKDGIFNAQYLGVASTIAPGATATYPASLYVGPKLQDGLVPPAGKSDSLFASYGLDTIAPGLAFTVDYGILTPICKPLFWIMLKFHKLTGNWGWSIILLTLVVKAVFYKLSEAQYRSMAKMKKFTPRIQEIKDRYANDREKQSKAMMDLYKKEGFNPLAGCWPLLVQFPVFLGLYWVLLESVELRQADFALWLNDLSSPDPFYVLPVLFGITFFVQQKWSGSTATMDPAQQKVMNVMPIIMTAFFAFFQSGLVLYWFVSNCIGMAQQWMINRTLSAEGLGRKAQNT